MSKDKSSDVSADASADALARIISMRYLIYRVYQKNRKNSPVS